MRRVAGLILLLGVLPLSVASRQVVPQSTPSFKGGVELLVLDVSVLDDKRQPVRALTAADFTILEDGKPQAVASFSAVDLPDVVTESTVAAPWVRTVAPDVQRNTDIKDRRIVLIVMDDATPMPAQEVILARASARQVVEALGRTIWHPWSTRSIAGLARSSRPTVAGCSLPWTGSVARSKGVASTKREPGGLSCRSTSSTCRRSPCTRVPFGSSRASRRTSPVCQSGARRWYSSAWEFRSRGPRSTRRPPVRATSVVPRGCGTCGSLSRRRSMPRGGQT